MNYGVMRSYRAAALSIVLSVAGVAQAQQTDTSLPPPATSSTTDGAEAGPPTEASAPAAVVEPAARELPPPPARGAPPTPEVTLPATNAARAVPSAYTYPARRSRGVLLAPQRRPVRPRRARVYGDAGAPLALGVGVNFGWPSDPGYAVGGLRVSHARVDMFAACDVWQPVAPLVISGGASFRALGGGSTDRAEIEERVLQADVMARYTAATWLFPHVRASAGTVGTRFVMHDMQDYSTNSTERRVTFEDKDWGAIGTLGAGFTVRTPARRLESHGGRLSSLSLGVLVEGGYALATVAKLRLKPTSSPATGFDLTLGRPGSLDRSAPYLRVIGVVRF